MFVTMPHFEQFMPAPLVRDGHKYWRAVTLSSWLSWYLFVYETECEGTKMSQTTLVAWEATLLQILEVIPREARRAICVFKSDDTGIWAERWIQTMWTAAPSEVEDTGSVLMQFRDDERVFDATFNPVPHADGRTLVFQAAATGNAPGFGSRHSVRS